VVLRDRPKARAKDKDKEHNNPLMTIINNGLHHLLPTSVTRI
jgi:hypothetical protein